MKTNEQLRSAVQEAMNRESLLENAEISIVAKDGVVTLTGMVDSYIKKIEAEEAAKNVAGVIAVVENIEMKFDTEDAEKPADKIASKAIHTIRWHLKLPEDKFQITIENGWIKIECESQSNHQKSNIK